MPKASKISEYQEVDILVLGAGNAALCAALEGAREGASVAVVEAADYDQRGGNTAYTLGVFRVGHNGNEDLNKLWPELSQEEMDLMDIPPYTNDTFYNELMERSGYKADPDLVEMLANQAYDTAHWFRDLGIRFLPMTGRVSFKDENGRYQLSGGQALNMVGGGQQAIHVLEEHCEKLGVSFYYETAGIDLLQDSSGAIGGLKVTNNGKVYELKSKAVVLACGGFEASPEMRARYLPQNADLLPVRGTPFNTGKGHEMALKVGAKAEGYWSGYHAVAVDMNIPMYGDMYIGDKFLRFSTPYCIMVNKNGERFHDEGEDILSYTYCRMGPKLLKQPDYIGWQIFDQQTIHTIMDEYTTREATKVESDTLEGLAEKLEAEGVNKEKFLETVNEYNAACQNNATYNPNILDGLRTKGLEIEKTNWAMQINSPPYVAFGCRAGMTFTYGGIKINTDGEVQSEANQSIPGLYATGEIVGGLYYEKYMGGNGMVAGTIFGRAGARAAKAYIETLE